MSTDEQIALNRRVAEALGWSHFTINAPAGWYGRPYHPAGKRQLEPLPDYCTDPAAADLVRQEIERRGWGCRLDYPCVGIVGEEERGWSCFIWNEEFEECACGKSSPYHALCLAFLAAHDATQQEQEARP